VLVAGVLLAALPVSGQTLWGLDQEGPLGAPPFLTDFHRGTVGPAPTLEGVVQPMWPFFPPHYLGAFPALGLAPGWVLPDPGRLGDVAMDRSPPLLRDELWAPLWATDGYMVANYTLGGERVRLLDAPRFLSGTPITGITVDPSPPPMCMWKHFWMSNQSDVAHVGLLGNDWVVMETFTVRDVAVVGGLGGITMDTTGFLAGGHLWLADLEGNVVLVDRKLEPLFLYPKMPVGPMLPPYTGIDVDTSIGRPGGLWITGGAGPGQAQFWPLPPLAPAPILLTPTNTPLAGLAYSPEPRLFGERGTCHDWFAPGAGFEGGFPVVGNEGFAVMVGNVPEGLRAWLFASESAIPDGLPVGDGSSRLYLKEPIFLAEAFAMRPNEYGFPIPLTADETMVGSTLYFQWAVFCPGSPWSLVLSDGLAVTLSGR
jgi:hypothetical protein